MSMIFGKKKSVEDRLDEILEEISQLPEEKQNEIWKKYDDSEDYSKGESETERQIEEAKENIAEKGADSQTEKDRIDESVGEQEKLDGNEDKQDAKDRVDESLGEKKYVERKDFDELLTRLSALEEKANGKEKLPKPKEVDNDELDEQDEDFFK